MEINDFNLCDEEIIASDSRFIKKHNNIYISDEQLRILKKYNFDVDKYKNVSNLIYDIEQYLNSSDTYLEDLDWVEENLSEYNYYCNTNK